MQTYTGWHWWIRFLPRRKIVFMSVKTELPKWIRRGYVLVARQKRGRKLCWERLLLVKNSRVVEAVTMPHLSAR